jgi:hypothetical protein
LKEIGKQGLKEIGRHYREATQRRVYQQTIKNLEPENIVLTIRKTLI